MGKIAVIVFLWGAIMASALAVVSVTHKSRLATHQLEQLRHQAADLQVESGQLLLEKSSLASYTRVEQIAVQKLEMKVPELNQMVIIKP